MYVYQDALSLFRAMLELFYNNCPQIKKIKRLYSYSKNRIHVKKTRIYEKQSNSAMFEN